MGYELVHASQAARAQERPEVLGYFYNHGGLNNQKLALAGLILSGLDQRRPVSLPYIYNRDQLTDQEYLVRFETVFDMNAVAAFVGRHGGALITDCPGGERGGWTYFEEFCSSLPTIRDPGRLALVLDTVSCLKPLIARERGFLHMKDFAFGTLGIDTVLQLRIEADWREHANNLRQVVGDTEDNGIGFAAILAKVKATFPDLRMAYATSDERAMPESKDEIRAFCRSEFGIELFWKPDLLGASVLETSTPLDLSLIDFEMARQARRFVGLTSSTFANMLAIEKLAENRCSVRGHYIYNHPGALLRERRDNGITSSAVAALNPTIADTLLAEIARLQSLPRAAKRPGDARPY